MVRPQKLSFKNRRDGHLPFRYFVIVFAFACGLNLMPIEEANAFGLKEVLPKAAGTVA
jgi:hypothetical protein